MRLNTLALLACMTAACDTIERLPGAPSSLTTGIVVFERADYGGRSAHLERDISDLSRPDGPCAGRDDRAKGWDDCVSSIRVSPGTQAVVFVDANFEGFGRTIDEDVPNLEFLLGPCRRASLDDCISSIRVTPR
jgi:hypothetical protein